MGKGLAMGRWRTGLALLLICGCTPTSRVIRAGDVPGPDEVVVIGRMSFVPEFQFQGIDHTLNGWRNKAILTLTWTAERPMNADGYRGHEASFVAERGDLFAVAIPRRTFYFRSILAQQAVTYTSTRSYSLPRFEFLVCPTVLQVTPRPEDRYIYVGLLACDWAQESQPPHVVVFDEWSQIEPRVRKRVGDAVVVPRWPTLIRPGVSSF